MANLRAAQKAMTRQRLLETALETFVTQGYSATTIDDIASAAGTTRVTFYAHFPSRKDVMVELIHELNRLLDRSEDSAHGSTAIALVDAVEEGTIAAIGAWIHAQVVHWAEIKPYILAATEASAVDPEIRALFEGWFIEVAADIVDGLDRAERHEPQTRHYRGRLAMAQLDFTALQWMRGDGAIDPAASPEVAVLIESWTKLLGAEHTDGSR